MGRLYPVRPFAGAAAVIKKDDKLLLIKRGVPPSKALWSFPGGGVELGESLVEALTREVKEECGLDIEIGPVAGVFDVLHRDTGGEVSYHYVLVDFWANYIGGKPLAGSDAAEIQWVKWEETLTYPLAEGTKALIEHYLSGNKEVIYQKTGGIYQPPVSSKSDVVK